MNVRRVLSVTVLTLLGCVGMLAAQDKAVVQADKQGPFHPGDTITFNIKLNEPLPKGAHFDFRISPVVEDEEVALGSGEAVGTSDTEFKVVGKLPDNALPGDWHIRVIWLFLPGASWTGHSISPNDLRFHVEGKPYPIPSQADVTIAR